MLHKVRIKVCLVRSKDAFCLLDDTPADAKVEIMQAPLFVHKAKISPSVFLAHAQALKTARPSIKYKEPSAKRSPFHTIFET